MVLGCYYSDDIVSIYAHDVVTTIMTLYEDVSNVMFVSPYRCKWLRLCLALYPSYGPTLREKEKLLQPNRLPHMYKQECINFQAESRQGFAAVSYDVCPILYPAL